MGVEAGFGQELPNKGLFIAMYTLSVAFFMPTIALANTTAFATLKNNGYIDIDHSGYITLTASGKKLDIIELTK